MFHCSLLVALCCHVTFLLGLSVFVRAWFKQHVTKRSRLLLFEREMQEERKHGLLAMGLHLHQTLEDPDSTVSLMLMLQS